MKRHHSPFAGVAGLLLALLLSACEKNETGPRPAAGEYYPTAAGLEWHYLLTWSGSTDVVVPVQTIAGDTLVGSHPYTKVMTTYNFTRNPPQSLYALVRKENGNYFEIKVNPWSTGPNRTEERVFLKDYAKVGDQWSYQEVSAADPGSLETVVFRIKAIDRERMIDGLTYLSTIEVQENTYLTVLKDNRKRLFSSRHAIYAKDRGLVHETMEHFDYRSYSEKTLKTGPF